MKIKIISLPNQQQDSNIDGSQQMSFAYGGQNSRKGLDIGQSYVDPSGMSFSTDPFDSVSKTIQRSPRNQSSIEAEGGETLVRNQPDGSITQFDINGASHANGGVPLAAKPGDFIFSKTKKMEIGGPLLEVFGKSADTKKKYSPAALSKQYDINKFQAILADPESDKLQKKTASLMIDNFTKKLGGLAFVQEAKKSFPNGIPQLAIQAMQMSKQGQQGTSNGQEQPSMRFGGKFQVGGQMSLPGQSSIYPSTTDVFPAEGVPALPQHEDPIMVNDTFNTPYSGEMDHTFDMKHPGTATPSNQVPYDFDFRNQDKAAMALGQLQYAQIKKYPSYIAPLQMVAPKYTLSDNSAEKASIAGAARSQSMIGALTSEGAHGRSNDSQIWGEALSRIMGSDAQNEEKRITTSNQGNKETTEITNKQLEFNQQRLSELYRQGILSQQQYDSAIREGQNKLLLAPYEKAMDNRAHMDWVNSMNVNSGFSANPRTGRIEFNGQANSNSSSGKNDFGATLASYQKDIIDHNPGIPPKLAWTMADNQLRMDRSRSNVHPMNPKANTYSNTSGNYGSGDEQGYGTNAYPY